MSAPFHFGEVSAVERARKRRRRKREARRVEQHKDPRQLDLFDALELDFANPSQETAPTRATQRESTK